MIDKRVRYQPICFGDETMKPGTRSGFIRKNSLRIALLLSVIVLISFYSFGLFSYLAEEDFTKFKYPLEIEDAHSLIVKIDDTIIGNGNPHTRALNHSTIGEVLDRIKSTDSRWLSVKPLPQFSGLDYSLDIRTTCEEQWKAANKSPIHMVIVVKSAVNNYERREAIRGSWYLDQNHGPISFKTVFMVGRCDEKNPVPESIREGNRSWSTDHCNDNIAREAATKGDIIQSSGIDSYYNNTVKTFMTLRWLTERCQSDFVMLIDDDYVLEVDNLVKYMIDLSANNLVLAGHDVNTTKNSTSSEKTDAQTNGTESARHPQLNGALNETDLVVAALRDQANDYLYAGYLRDYVHPGRIAMTKWYITREEYAYNKYPRFITGGSILMTHKTVKHMYYATYFTNKFKFDDVYIGILAMKLGIEPTHADSFMCTLEDYMDAKPVRSSSTSCIGVHDIEPKALLELWRQREQAAPIGDESKSTSSPS